MDRFRHDLIFGLRMLGRNLSLSLVAVAALGLGISGVTTQFSVINAAFLKGLPFPEPDRIVHVERVNPRLNDYMAEVPILEYREYRDRQSSFEALGGFYQGTVNLTVDGTPRRHDGTFITANFLEILRTDPILGRGIRPPDDRANAPLVIMIGYDLWQREYSADPHIVGKSVVMNGKPAEIVGVMPPGFSFPIQEEIWVPLFKQQDPARLTWGDDGVVALEVFGRLKKGVSRDEATADLSTIAKQLETEYPESNAGFSQAKVKAFIDEYLGDETAAVLGVMLIITVLILLIACANVANLLMAKTMRRSKELAIRTALGATRRRIITQLLVESMILAVLGMLAALVLSHFAMKSIMDARQQMQMPFWFRFDLDYRFLLSVAFTTIAAGVVSGLIPALRASRQNVSEILKDDTRTSSSHSLGLFARSLVVVQIGFSCIILVFVFLMVQSIRNARQIDWGYDTGGCMTARMALFEEEFPTARDRYAFLRALEEKLIQEPEVDHVAFSTRYRFLDTGATSYQLDGTAYQEDEELPYARHHQVTEAFLDVIKGRVVQGRFFNRLDFGEEAQPVCVINTVFSQREFPEANPIGKMIRLGDGSPMADGFIEPWRQVVGVVESMHEQGLNEKDDGSAILVPISPERNPSFITVLAAGPGGDPRALASIMRKAVVSLHGNLPLYAVGTPQTLIDEDLGQFTFISDVFLQFGAIAVFLASIGIYGVVSFSVNQRTAEFGIRQAIGARPVQIFRLILGQGTRQLAVALAGALLVILLLNWTPLMDTISQAFYEVDTDDVRIYLAIVGVLAFVTFIASFFPAIRASRVNPAHALRYE